MQGNFDLQRSKDLYIVNLQKLSFEKKFDPCENRRHSTYVQFNSNMNHLTYRRKQILNTDYIDELCSNWDYIQGDNEIGQHNSSVQSRMAGLFVS